MPVAQVRDVARRAGVSPATVSNALNHPTKVSPATRERILTAIEELGFVRNRAARALRSGTSDAIGMIVLDVANPFFTDVAVGVEDALEASGRQLILGTSAQDRAREAAYLDLFEEQRVAGILITPAGRVLDRLRRLRERRTAVVLVDRRAGVREFSSVTVDDRLGGRLAASHLVELGHTSVAFVGGPERLSQVRHRLGSAREVVEGAGGRVRFLETATMDAAAGRGATEQLLLGPTRCRPTAILGANDLVALGALQALTLAGVRVPDDMAIVGYDDIEFAAAAAVPLTSVRQPAAEMGRRAAALLVERLDRSSSVPVRHEVLLPRLVVRRSTDPAAASDGM